MVICHCERISSSVIEAVIGLIAVAILELFDSARKTSPPPRTQRRPLASHHSRQVPDMSRRRRSHRKRNTSLTRLAWRERPRGTDAYEVLRIAEEFRLPEIALASPPLPP